MAGRHSANTSDHAHARAIARQVRILHDARGWSAERLAVEAGIGLSMLRRLESEGATQPGFFTVGAIAGALNVSLDELYRQATPSPGL